MQQSAKGHFAGMEKSGKVEKMCRSGTGGHFNLFAPFSPFFARPQKIHR
jgi:hypothetical protein